MMEIIVGFGVFLLLLGIYIFYLERKRRKQNQENEKFEGIEWIP